MAIFPRAPNVRARLRSLIVWLLGLDMGYAATPEQYTYDGGDSASDGTPIDLGGA